MKIKDKWTHCKIKIIVTCDKIFSIFSIFKRYVSQKTKSVACKNIFIDLRCGSNDNKNIKIKNGYEEFEDNVL